MSDELDTFVKRINRFNAELGRVVTYISHVCVNCLEFKNERRAVAINLGEFEFQEMKFNYIALPLCMDCPIDIKLGSEQVMSFIDGPHIEAIIV